MDDVKTVVFRELENRDGTRWHGDRQQNPARLAAALIQQIPALRAADVTEVTQHVVGWQRRMFWFTIWRIMSIGGIFGSDVTDPAGRALSYEEARAIAAEPPIGARDIVDGQDWPGDDGTTIGILVVRD